MATPVLIDTDILIDAGRSIAEADALIAATALASGSPLLTKNKRDYRFITGLTLLPYP